jgi:hypothetical protein
MQKLEHELSAKSSDIPNDRDAIADEEIIDAEYWEEGK